MGSVAALAVTVAAAAGAVAAIRFVERRREALRRAFRPGTSPAERDAPVKILDYERDDATGIYRQKP